MPFTRRSHVPFMLAWIVGLSLGAGCAANMDPASPSGSTQTDTQTASSGVHTTGDLTFSNCGSSAGCTFAGEVANDTSGCVSNVRGVTHLFDRDGKEIASQSWTINGRVRPGQHQAFSGCCFSSSAANNRVTDKTDVKFTTIQCI